MIHWDLYQALSSSQDGVCSMELVYCVCRSVCYIPGQFGLTTRSTQMRQKQKEVRITFTTLSAYILVNLVSVSFRKLNHRVLLKQMKH
jgi:hypothetical protein